MPGRRAGDHDDPGAPPASSGAACGRRAEPPDEPPHRTPRRSTRAPDHMGRRRRRGERRARIEPAGGCPPRSPWRTRREVAHEGGGMGDRPNIGLCPIPRRPWSQPGAFVFSACRMAPLSTGGPRPGELPGRPRRSLKSRREGQKSADGRGHQRHRGAEATGRGADRAGGAGLHRLLRDASVAAENTTALLVFGFNRKGVVMRHADLREGTKKGG